MILLLWVAAGSGFRSSRSLKMSPSSVPVTSAELPWPPPCVPGFMPDAPEGVMAFDAAALSLGAVDGASLGGSDATAEGAAVVAVPGPQAATTRLTTARPVVQKPSRECVGDLCICSPPRPMSSLVRSTRTLVADSRWVAAVTCAPISRTSGLIRGGGIRSATISVDSSLLGERLAEPVVHDRGLQDPPLSNAVCDDRG